MTAHGSIVGSAPKLVGARVALRPVTPSDYPYLFDLATNPGVGFRWRLRGAIPSPANFEVALWEQVFAQFVVWDARGTQRQGLVTAYAADSRNRIAYFAIVQDPRGSGSPRVFVDSIVLFMRYLFAVWDFRKLYAESPGYAFVSFASGAGKFFDVEGRLPDYHYFDGRYWENVIISVSREAFEAASAPVLPRILGEQLNGDEPAGRLGVTGR